MDLEAVKQIISSEGWSPQERKRKRGTTYLYAARWIDGKTRWRYIGVVSQVDQLSKQEILTKLNK